MIHGLGKPSGSAIRSARAATSSSITRASRCRRLTNSASQGAAVALKKPTNSMTSRKTERDRANARHHDAIADMSIPKGPLVVLPTPLPPAQSSPIDSFHFPRTPQQERLNIIDACMYRGYDMRRARKLFNDVRDEARSNKTYPPPIPLYNQFIETYMDQCVGAVGEEAKAEALKLAWDMYTCLRTDNVAPNYNTLALALILWQKFEVLEAASPPDLTVASLLKHATLDNLSVPMIAERVLASSNTTAKERNGILTAIQRWAVAEGRTEIIYEVARISDAFIEKESSSPNISARRKVELLEDDNPLKGIPDVRPVEELNSKSEENVQDPEESPQNAHPANMYSEITSPYNLEALRASMKNIINSRRHLASDPAARQKLVEESAISDAKDKLEYQYKQLEERGLQNLPVLKRSVIGRWMWNWYNRMVPRLTEEIEKQKLKEAEKPRTRTTAEQFPLSAFLSVLPVQQLSILTIMEVLRIQGSGGIEAGMKTTRALIEVGAAVEAEYDVLQARKRQRTFLDSFDEAALHADGSSETPNGSMDGLQGIRERRIAAMRDAEANSSSGELGVAPKYEWSRLVHLRIGSVLVDALVDTAMLTRTIKDPNTGQEHSEEQPAFNHEYEYSRGQKLGVIKLNPALAKQFARGGAIETLHPRHLPMFIPPNPWVSPDTGGYMYNSTNVVRIRESFEQTQYIARAHAEGNLETLYSALDVLGSTPWAINRKVFEVVLAVWNSGEALAGIPPAETHTPEIRLPDDTDPLDRKRYVLEVKEALNLKRNNHADRCSTNYKMEIARTFLPDKFYFPHNVDFRGRAYPIPSHLNHIGDDLCRGLLKFYDAKPLGERGWRWLKIHVSNLYGFDKASLDDREKWTMDHMEDILDSAARPLEGKRFWLQSDDPWQMLGACFEVAAALEHTEGPEAYESNLPVHQDGTCNGLQHYAALGGDVQGAQQVNLDVTDKPSDVYTFVAKMVEELVAADAAKGSTLAKNLQGKIARKVVKQTVMTTVYGVTYVGARAQIEKQLKTIIKDRDELWEASGYVAALTIKCIGNLFFGAKQIQTWLSRTARLVTKSIPSDRLAAAIESTQSQSSKKTARTTLLAWKSEMMTSMVWTSPIGLPVVQPYRQLKRKQLKSKAQSVYISDPGLPSPVSAIKQASAFPPNFVHSLDATHMIYTALGCRRDGLTFAAVHDSFWTHASSVDRMSEIIRDTFVSLHTSDTLSKLRDELHERLKGYVIPIPTLTLNDIASINAVGKAQIKFTNSGSARKCIITYPSLEDEGGENTRIEVEMEAASEVDDEEAENVEEAEPVEAPKKRRRRRTKAEIAAQAEEESDPTSEAAPKKRRSRANPLGVIPLEFALPEVPIRGSYNVENVKKSLYFFS